MANLEKIVDDLQALTMLEAAELSRLIEEKWGVGAARFSPPAGGPATGVVESMMYAYERRLIGGGYVHEHI